MGCLFFVEIGLVVGFPEWEPQQNGAFIEIFLHRGLKFYLHSDLVGEELKFLIL